MNDMSATTAIAQERCGGIVERRVERDLGLHAGDAIHRESIPALEFLHQGHELRVEAIVRHLLGRESVYLAQAVAQPAHARITRAQRERLRAAGGRPPQKHIVTEPASREIADADLALRAAQVHLRVFVVETGEHDLVSMPGGVDDIEHRGAVE